MNATEDPEPTIAAAGEARQPPAGRRLLAYGVHLLTASGVVLAALAVRELWMADTDPRWVFVWLIGANIVDAADGPLARRFQVKALAPEIHGRTIDDIVDYLTFTFIPLMLVWKSGWLPEGLGWLIAPALIASLFGFANVAAKQERAGFFLGFPSYWNAVAFYLGLSHALVAGGLWWNAVVVAALTLLTVAPVRFIYPNLAPAPWRPAIIAGAIVWALLLAAMLPAYPTPPGWLVLLSLVYPLFYVLVSVMCDVRTRTRQASSGGG